MVNKFLTSAQIIILVSPIIQGSSKPLKERLILMVSVWVQSDLFVEHKTFTNNWKVLFQIITTLKTVYCSPVVLMPTQVSSKPFILLKILSSVTRSIMLQSSMVWDFVKPKRPDTNISIWKIWNNNSRPTKMQDLNWSLLMEFSQWMVTSLL